MPLMPVCPMSIHDQHPTPRMKVDTCKVRSLKVSVDRELTKALGKSMEV